jgi:hypothetical protein
MITFFILCYFSYSRLMLATVALFLFYRPGGGLLGKMRRFAKQSAFYCARRSAQRAKAKTNCETLEQEQKMVRHV